MAGLPVGWEADYDGQRWFYKFKPTGLVQYHFPTEGDEFPDFVDSLSPAPDLAPEERLESQQQVKRQTSTSGTEAPARRTFANANKNSFGMSATAKPVSAVLEVDDEDAVADGTVFQPENFMFLGPGTYADVSPLNEEEEEAAKKTVAGGAIRRSQSKNSDGKATGSGVSPMASGGTTPMTGKSEPHKTSPPPVPDIASVGNAVIESPPVIGSPPVIERPPVIESAPVMQYGHGASEMSGESAVQILDSREIPAEMLADTAQRFNPVGFIAEMPTEHTATAHIERHPDPVEIADNTVLAPIETATAQLLAQEAAKKDTVKKSSPVDGKVVPTLSSPRERVKNEEIKPAHDSAAPSAPAETQQTSAQPSAPDQVKKEPEITQPIFAADTAGLPAKQEHASQAEQPKPLSIQPPSQPSDEAQSPSSTREPFKIARKLPGSTPASPVYHPYAPGPGGQAGKTRQDAAQNNYQNANNLQSEELLVMHVQGGTRSPTETTGIPVPLSLQSRNPAAVENEWPRNGGVSRVDSYGFSEVPPALRPASGRALSQTDYQVQTQESAQSTPASGTAQYGSPSDQTQATSPPGPTASNIQTLCTAQAPLAQASNAQISQPAEAEHTESVPSAAMPSAVHPGPSQSSPQNQQQEHGSAFAILPTAPVQNAAAGQPVRLQSVMGPRQQSMSSTGAQQYPSSVQPSQSAQRPPTQVTPEPSTATASEISHIRSRTDSQASAAMAMQTPSPLDPFRRSSANEASIQGVAAMNNFTPSPFGEQSVIAEENATTQSAASPPVPPKVMEHVQGSFFPPQSATVSTPAHPPAPPPKDAEQREEQAPGLPAAIKDRSHEYPIGYHVKRDPGHSSVSQPSQAGQAQMSQTQTSANQPSANVPEQTEHSGPATQQSPAPSQNVLMNPQADRRSSMASSVQPSTIPGTPASSQGPTIFQPKPVNPSGRPAQALMGSPTEAAQPGQMAMAPGQGPPMQPPPGHTGPGQMAPQGYASQGPPGMGIQVPNMPPQGMAPAQNTKEKKWTKWFKGGSKAKQPQAPPIQPPAQILPGPSPGVPYAPPSSWGGGPFSPAHVQPGTMSPAPGQGMMQQPHGNMMSPPPGPGMTQPYGNPMQPPPGQVIPGNTLTPPPGPGMMQQGMQQQFRPGPMGQSPTGAMPQGNTMPQPSRQSTLGASSISTQGSGPPPQRAVNMQGPNHQFIPGPPMAQGGQPGQPGQPGPGAFHGQIGPTGGIMPPQAGANHQVPGAYQHGRQSSNVSIPSQHALQQNALQQTPYLGQPMAAGQPMHGQQMHGQQMHGQQMQGQQMPYNGGPPPANFHTMPSPFSPNSPTNGGMPPGKPAGGPVPTTQPPPGDYSGGGWGNEQQWQHR